MRNILGMIAAIGLALGYAPAASATEVLITTAEAMLPDLSGSALSMRSLTRGPAVEQISPVPRSKGTKSPLPFQIRFTAHNDTTVVPDSVKITYLKSPAVDLTPRLKAHITPTGIEMSDVEVPPGTHMLRVEIRDSQGRSGTGIVTLTVAP
jgi:hypothetical protein